MYTFAIEENALVEVPCFESHQRGKNWLAVISSDPSAPGGLHREFQPRGHGGYYYLVSGLKVGQPIEFGADYYSGSGRKSSLRFYGVITALTEQSLSVEKTDTGKQAIKMSRERFEEIDPLTALKEEREKLLARLSEIDALLSCE